ncbi:GNAT family N-acetyltransferase [Alteribacter lacisalsi]|uniref:GNAT family N-acetyltransferase n=1 Tax=Alteribacter lacisalsi TaxID=2045244 RepID=A0A2W0HPV1_9BACI|nr:GNAT family N-acetyltransferase [Alteribacter lacisalsi]
MVVPANKASWEDLEAVLGSARCHGAPCYCQRFKISYNDWSLTDDQERAFMLRAQTDCGNPESNTTSGLVAYLDQEPVGWCAVEPRTAYKKLRSSPVPWSGRDEDKNDNSVMAISCFIVRKGYRRRKITYALAKASISFARKRRAHAIEGYPMRTVPGKDIPWGELHVGSRNAFIAAGFREVSAPTKRRVVMRIDFK